MVHYPPVPCVSVCVCASVFTHMKYLFALQIFGLTFGIAQNVSTYDDAAMLLYVLCVGRRSASETKTETKNEKKREKIIIMSNAARECKTTSNDDCTYHVQ